MGRLDGKVALVTGAARGQGRSHARLLAREGADIVAVDICSDIDGLGYPLGTSDELGETAALVEAEGRKVLARQADVRDVGVLERIVQDAYTVFGRIDVVCANAGICQVGPRTWEIAEDMWDAHSDVVAKGVWATVRPVIPRMIEAGRGGSIIITSSLLGLKGMPRTASYTAAKFAVVGLAQTLAAEVGQYGIRVNTVHPSTTATDINFKNEPLLRAFRPDLDHLPSREEFGEASSTLHLLHEPGPASRHAVPWLEVEDISNAVLFLASDEARHITGLRMTVDAGALIK
ncbi:mycofactocin-coupled SDR family oxidoreductase [Streptomyces sp. NPDC003393]